MIKSIIKSVVKDVGKSSIKAMGISWSSYWTAQKEPTDLTSEVISPEIMDLVWVDPVELSDGIKIYLSTDNGVNYTYSSTVANGIESTRLTGLTPGTNYTIKIVSYKGSQISTGVTDINITAAYLTISILGTNAEQYNSNKGFRRKAGASGWGNYTANGCLFNETLSNGERIILKVNDADAAIGLLLADSYNAGNGGIPLLSSYVNVHYGIYSGSGLTTNAQFIQNAALIAGNKAIVAGDLLRLDYSGSYIKMDHSNNGGVTWTNHKTSTVEPSGVYYILFDAYSGGGGFDEIYKVSNKSIGKLSTNQEWLFAFVGESNSGGYAVNADLSAGELAARSAVQIWNNTTNAYEDLDIGTNNLISHDGLPDNATHGWENGLATKVEDGTLPNPVYLAKCGQGGSLVSHWETTDVFYTTMIARIKANINAIVSTGKIPRVVIWFTLGINDIINSTNEATWKTATEALLSNIRKQLGLNILIVFPKFMTSYDSFNDSIDAIVAADSKTVTFDTTNLTTYPKRDTAHWNSVGMKNMAAAMVSATKNYYGI